MVHNPWWSISPNTTFRWLLSLGSLSLNLLLFYPLFIHSFTCWAWLETWSLLALTALIMPHRTQWSPLVGILLYLGGIILVKLHITRFFNTSGKFVVDPISVRVYGISKNMPLVPLGSNLAKQIYFTKVKHIGLFGCIFCKNEHLAKRSSSLPTTLCLILTNVAAKKNVWLKN
jgi:hypothetical protein